MRRFLVRRRKAKKTKEDGERAGTPRRVRPQTADVAVVDDKNLYYIWPFLERSQSAG